MLLANVVDTKENPEPKVLVVDGDRTCLTIIGRILQFCSFKVTKCDKGREALTTLETSENEFDMVITDLQVPDMDGMDLLTNITSLKINVPVIVTSAYDNEDVLKNARRHGASGYLVKPIRVEYIRQVWTYVYEVRERHRINNKRSIEGGGSNSEEDSKPNYRENWIIAGSTATTTTTNNIMLGVENDYSRSNKGEGHKCITKKRKAYHPQENNYNDQESINVKNKNKDGDVNAQVMDPNEGTNSVITQPARKKQRVIWTPELHDKFVAAVNQFGTSKAVPKKILEFMNIPGLTRENVASHLQKYRQYHKKQERSLQEKSDGNLMKLASSKEHKCSKRIFQTKPRNQDVTNPAFSACKTAQVPLKIEADTKQEMTIPTGKAEMRMALGEVVTEANIVTSYPYSTNDSSFHFFETPNPYWGTEFSYDENSVHSELASMTTVAQPYGYGEFSHDENSVHNEPIIASMMSFGQPYQIGDMLSQDENSVHNEPEMASMNVMQTYGYGDASFGANMYGNVSDLGYCDPYDTSILYGEPFDQNNEHIIAHLQQVQQVQQQGFGHNVGFRGVE